VLKDCAEALFATEEGCLASCFTEMRDEGNIEDELLNHLDGGVVWGPDIYHDAAFYLENASVLHLCPGNALGHPFLFRDRVLTHATGSLLVIALAVMYAPPGSCTDVENLAAGGADRDSESGTYLFFVEELYGPLCRDDNDIWVVALVTALIISSVRACLDMIMSMLGRCSCASDPSELARLSYKGTARILIGVLLLTVLCLCLYGFIDTVSNRDAIWVGVAAISEANQTPTSA